MKTIEMGTKGANQRAKLLAAFAAIVMVACVLCAIAPTTEATDATEYPEDSTFTGRTYTEAQFLALADDDGVITLGAGNYLLTETVDLNEAITIQGAGLDQTFIYGCFKLPGNATAYNVSINDLTLDGTTSTGNLSKGISTLDAHQQDNQNVPVNLTLDHVKIVDFKDKGIYLTNVQNLSITNCTFQNNSFGGDTGITGDYGVDLNLVRITGIEIEISNNTFVDVNGAKAAVKVTQRGGTGSDDNAFDIKATTGATITKLTMIDNDFSQLSAETSADIYIGSSGDDDKKIVGEDGSEVVAQPGEYKPTYTTAFPVQIVANGATSVSYRGVAEGNELNLDLQAGAKIASTGTLDDVTEEKNGGSVSIAVTGNYTASGAVAPNVTLDNQGVMGINGLESAGGKILNNGEFGNVAGTNDIDSILTNAIKVNANGAVTYYSPEDFADLGETISVTSIRFLPGTQLVSGCTLDFGNDRTVILSDGFGTNDGAVAFGDSNGFYISSTDAWNGSIDINVDEVSLGTAGDTLFSAGDLAVDGSVKSSIPAEIYGDLSVGAGASVIGADMIIGQDGSLTVDFQNASGNSFTVNANLYVLGEADGSGTISFGASAKLYTVDGTDRNIDINIGSKVVDGVASYSVSSLDDLAKYDELGFTVLNFNVTGGITLPDGFEFPEGKTIYLVGQTTGSTPAYTTIGVEDGADSKHLSEVLIPAGTIIYLQDVIVDVPKNAVLINEGNIRVASDSYGEISGAGTLDLSGNGAINGSVVITIANATGNVMEYHGNGSTTQDLTFPVYQKVIVDEGDTWIISSENTVIILGTLEVYGDIIVQDGGQLILGNGIAPAATATIGGSITVNEGGDMQLLYANASVEGELVVNGTLSVLNQSDLSVEANMTVSSTGVIASTDDAQISVDTDGVLTIEGYLGNSTNGSVVIDNAGSVIIDNAGIESRYNVSAGSATISLVSAGASVTVESFYVESASSRLTINDEGLALGTYSGTSYVVGANGTNTTGVGHVNSIEISGAAGVSLTGSAVFTSVTDVATVDNVRTYTNAIQMTGAITNTTEEVNDAVADVTIGISTTAVATGLSVGSVAYVIVPAEGSLVVSADVAVTINQGANLKVAGYLDMTATESEDTFTKISNSGVIDVTGEIKVYENEIGATINAAWFTATEMVNNARVDYQVYTTLEQAVVDIMDATNVNTDKTITVCGQLTVTESMTVPSGVHVVFKERNASTNSLTIGIPGNADVIVTVENGADMTSRSYQVVVNGSLTFVNKQNDATRDTVSDVTVEDEAANGSRTYTNIYTALNNAEAGQTVVVTKESAINGVQQYVELYANATVKQGVTLLIEDDVAPLLLDDGVTLTIDGTVTTYQQIYAETMFDVTAKNIADSTTAGDCSSAIVVNGTLASEIETDYAYAPQAPNASSYAMLFSNTTAAASGAPIAGAYYTDGEMYYISTLDIALSSAVLANTEGAIVVNGVVTAGDLVFASTDDCNEITVGASINAEIPTSLTVSSLALSGSAMIEANGPLTGTVTAGDASIDVAKITGMTAAVDDAQLVLSGRAVTDSEDGVTLSVAAGTVYTAEAGFTVVGDAFYIAAGAILEVDGTLAFDDLVVNGTLNVPAGKSVSALTGDITVFGTVTVAAQTETTAPGQMIVDNAYIGIDSEFETEVPAAAYNGPMTVTTAFVLEGTAVDAVAQAVLDAKAPSITEYYVNQNLWLTAYGFGTINEVTTAPHENAWFNGWLDENGNDVENTDAIGNPDAVYADIRTNVYNIYLLADVNAVSSVSIDGNLMQYGMVGNFLDGYNYAFTTTVAAGSHTVSYELANGYSGTGMLTVNDGTPGTDMTFEATGTPTSSAGIYIYLQLTGFQKSGYVPDSPDTPTDTGSSDDGMTITDYLLIILVVLIIVMAIIVAKRLMRS